jgi:hypothetical protein
MCLADADNQIEFLACLLNPDDRAPFILAAEAALAGVEPSCWGPGLTHRILTPIWHAYFRPPDTGHLSRWDRDDQPPPSLLVERGRDRRRGRRAPVVAKTIEFRGVVFVSRQALATHLATMVDRDPSAVVGMLVKLNDDSEALLQHYAAKELTWRGRRYHSRSQLAQDLAPAVHRRIEAVMAALAKFKDNAEAVVDYYRERDRAAAREPVEA